MPEAVAFIKEQQNIARDKRDKERDLETTRLSLQPENKRLQHQIESARMSHPRNPETAAVLVENPKLPQYRHGEDVHIFLFALNESRIY